MIITWNTMAQRQIVPCRSFRSFRTLVPPSMVLVSRGT